MRGNLGFDISPSDFLPRRPILSNFTRWRGHSDKRSPQMKLVMVHMCQMNHAAQTGPRWISYHPKRTAGGGEKEEEDEEEWTCPCHQWGKFKRFRQERVSEDCVDAAKQAFPFRIQQLILKEKRALNQSKGRAFVCDLTQPAVQIHVPHFYY